MLKREVMLCNAINMLLKRQNCQRYEFQNKTHVRSMIPFSLRLILYHSLNTCLIGEWVSKILIKATISCLSHVFSKQILPKLILKHLFEMVDGSQRLKIPRHSSQDVTVVFSLAKSQHFPRQNPLRWKFPKSTGHQFWQTRRTLIQNFCEIRRIWRNQFWWLQVPVSSCSQDFFSCPRGKGWFWKLELCKFRCKDCLKILTNDSDQDPCLDLSQEIESTRNWLLI